MCRVTKKDKIRNEHVRRSVKLAPVTQVITEKRLKWYGHIKRRLILRHIYLTFESYNTANYY